MKKLRSTAVLLLVLCTLLSMVAPAAAAYVEPDWFLVHYPDPHFDLSQEPDRVATVEEFIAYVTAKAYYAEGSTATQVPDKNGELPSAWCGKYVQAEIAKGIVDPKTYAYSEPATIAFVAEYFSRAKGKYHYDYENTYNFSYTSTLSAEQKMYLNVAADYKLIPYTNGMNALQTIPRSQLGIYASILANKDLPTVTAPVLTSNNSMKELNVYFIHGGQLDQLKKYGKDITMVSFHLCNIISHPNNGHKYLYESLQDEGVPEAIAYCNENGILPLLSVANFDTDDFDTVTALNVLNSESAADEAIAEIVSVARENGLKGVNLGLEHLPASGRNNFVKFLTKLNTALDGQGMVLMTTVGAFFQATDEAASFYDYSAIANISDYVHVILYDDNPDTAYNAWQINAPDVVSDMVRIDRVLKYIVARIPAGKVILGTASFGVDFDTTAHKALDTDRPILVGLSNGNITEDPGTLAGHFNYTDSNGHAHTVYLETDNGIRARLLRCYRYGLCGASTYHLGSEHPALMQNATSLSGNKTEVMNAVRAGLVPTGLRGMYTSPITRAQFCDVIAAMITAKSGKSLDGFLQEKGVSVRSGMFTDTNAPNVLAAAALGIVNGRGNGLFAPNDTITRQEAAAMLMRLAKCLGKSASGAAMNFTDTAALPAWAKEGIGYTSSIADPTNNKRVMNGTGSNKFSPLGTYTREQAFMTAIRLFHAL